MNLFTYFISNLHVSSPIGLAVSQFLPFIFAVPFDTLFTSPITTTVSVYTYTPTRTITSVTITGISTARNWIPPPKFYRMNFLRLNVLFLKKDLQTWNTFTPMPLNTLIALDYTNPLICSSGYYLNTVIIKIIYLGRIY